MMQTHTAHPAGKSGSDNAASRAVHCDTMVDVRTHIDALDEQIVALLAERSGYVRQAARIKNDASQIVDQPRIDAIVSRMGERMAGHGGPPAVAEATWRAMIAAFIEFEHVEFAHRQQKPAGSGAAS